MTHAPGTRYRPEIDGLRTIAVVPVVLYHLGVAWVPGGFVGVDVFFVISGFLITGILLRDMDAGRYSLLTFYERRARRILPNLLAMVAFASVLALIIAIPLDLLRFGQSVLATLGFASNVLFYWRGGYFEPATGQLPLLHTWSLGVEEQYYLLFPLALSLVRRSRTAMVAGMAGSLLASLLLAQWQVAHTPNAAFYLPFARWWELMVGSLLAVAGDRGRAPRAVRTAVSLTGLLMIAGAVAWFSASTPFPGLAALLPCLGAGALLIGERDGLTPVGQLIASAPLRAIGVVSYALYLWHWPVIVFAHYVLQRAFTPIEMVAIAAVIVALATASYRWIETPMRQRAVSRRILLQVIGAAAAALAALAAVMVAGRGLPHRYPAAIRPLALGTDLINPDRVQCDSPSLPQLAAGGVCVIGAPGVAPSFALVGDSFADALMPGFAAAAAHAGVSGVVMTYSGCSVLAGAGTTPRCRQAADAVFATIAANSAIRKVVLVSRWTTLVEGRREGLFPQDGIWLDDDAHGVPGVANNRHVIAQSLARTIATLRPRGVTVVYGMPEPLVFVPQFATVRALLHAPIAGLSRTRYDARQAATRALLEQVVPASGGHLLDLRDAMCGPAQCPITDGTTPLYVDDNHPSRLYAKRLAPILTPAIAR